MSAADTLLAVNGGASVDYFALSGDDKRELIRLCKAARYRQSASAKAAGRSRWYSFYLSLQRRAAIDKRGR